jgi:predicted RNA-binding protein with PUA-like domain
MAAVFRKVLRVVMGPESRGVGSARGFYIATMANYWILKTEPSSYSYDDLQREGVTTWDGVANPVALRNIRSMREGDQVMIYHTGDQKAIVGFASVASAPRPDPRDPRLVVIDLKAGSRLPRPVTLAAIKADPAFADLALVRQGRLSVVSVSAPLWKRLSGMGTE